MPASSTRVMPVRVTPSVHVTSGAYMGSAKSLSSPKADFALQGAAAKSPTHSLAPGASTLLQPLTALDGPASRTTAICTMPFPASSPRLSSFRKQHLLIEFSTLRHAQLDGVFVSITPGDPSLWVGVIYPALPPLVTFSTDVFHPLLTPLTTYTHTTATLDTDTVSATDEERLPPGGFSLRHGFPHWFGRARRSVASSRGASGSEVGSPAPSVTPVHSVVESAAPGSAATGVSIVTVLDYIRSTFSEDAVLDSVSLEAAANPGAYHAWRAYRGPALPTQQPLSPVSSTSGEGTALARNRRAGNWNWEGVWEERVKRAINTSLSESVLYGPGAGEDIIRFQEADDEETTQRDAPPVCSSTRRYGAIGTAARTARCLLSATSAHTEEAAKTNVPPTHISSDIWGSPLGYRSLLDLAAPLQMPSTWNATSLPVSRLPSKQPLTIRKNRESRSSASGSSMGDPTHFFRSASQDDAHDGGPVEPASAATPWPLLDTYPSNETTRVTSTLSASGIDAREAFESTHQVVEACSLPTKRRPSALRLFTGLARLRRANTGETSASSGDTSDLVSPASIAAHNDDIDEEASQEPSEYAVEAYIRRNARNGARLGSIMSRIARHLPSPMEHHHDDQETQVLATSDKAPTTLRAAVRVFSDVAELSEQEQQEFWIAIEVEGALHNRVSLPDSAIDVVFVVDNAYYVSRECLSRALDAVNSALYNLGRGDRVALYTTHCTHQPVTGIRPDLLFPIGPFNPDTEVAFRDLTTSVARYGTQAWKPPRPNPSMAEVILGIAKTLENSDMKKQRTHVILLSPASHVLHDVSRSCPDLYIHQINPAPVPFRRLPGLSDIQCAEECCKNVFISNWNHIQSIPGRIKRILKHARSFKPVGQISQVCIDLRARDGCEIIECVGSKDIASLRLGQVHTVFAKIRTTRSATKAVDLLSKNPVFNSSLDVKDLRQQLQNAATVGAVKVHLLDVQVYHQNTLHSVDCWSYTETPFIVVRSLGGLAPPFSTAVEVQKRRLFQNFIQHDAKTARLETMSLLSTLDHDQEFLGNFVQRAFQEVDHYQQVLEYEQECRQKLPLCPGPVTIEASSHEWLVGMWNRKKPRRQGVAIVEEDGISSLLDGLHGLERLG
ncbi:hypothetical protein OPT61_g8634 [Boeremia exigua]|uniref:Uncharacterized protein n=1 Tax=Boeremia exigua TaxID=749465 RepID=A0ACC2HXN3_9PLEO|nr:hypothetical protein OPT61_g8634 [Boeremia exigua]